MTIVFRAFFLALLCITIYYFFVRLPYLRAAVECNQTLMQVYQQKGTVIRRSYMTDEQICSNNRSLILSGIQCLRKLPEIIYVTPIEEVFLEKTAAFISRATKTPFEVVTQHNTACTSKQTKILYDLTLDDPYALNFE